MYSSANPREFIVNLLEGNGYGVRDGQMPGDDFRVFLTPPGFEVESEEVFKIKENDLVCCAASILLGGSLRESLFKQSEGERDKFKMMIKHSLGISDLDFFEMDDDGKDFRVSIRAEFPVQKLSEDSFADAMDRLNLAGGSIEDAINEYFGGVLGSQT